MRMLTPPRIVFIIFGVPGTYGENESACITDCIIRSCYVVRDYFFCERPVFERWTTLFKNMTHHPSNSFKHCCSPFPKSIPTQQPYQAVGKDYSALTLRLNWLVLGMHASSGDHLWCHRMQTSSSEPVLQEKEIIREFQTKTFRKTEVS